MPRETLTRPQIVDAAIELLDRDGIEGLSMRKLGTALGSGATSIYWHVSSRDNLIRLAADKVWAEVPLHDPAGRGWRQAAADVADDTYRMLAKHVWLIPAFSTHLLYGESLARYEDHCYSVYEAAGFTGTDLDWAFNTVFTFVLGTALGDAAERALRMAGAEEDGTLADAKREADELAQRYPRLCARLDAQRGIDPRTAQLDSLGFGVATILDGLEARLAKAGTQD
ncbi:TetR/AcrR family transcriptional regulator C-terminal domain-containing protein [Saccharomonospora sp. NPDC006951]